MKKMIAAIIIVNFLYSLFQFEAYSYYWKTSINNFKSAQELFNDNDKNMFRKENEMNVHIWNAIDEDNISSKKKWCVKLSLDAVALVLVIAFFVKTKSTSKQSSHAENE